jgi:hypothetical protein
MSYIEIGDLKVQQQPPTICYQELTEAFERLGYSFSKSKREVLQCTKKLSSSSVDTHDKPEIRNN